MNHKLKLLIEANLAGFTFHISSIAILEVYWNL